MTSRLVVLFAALLLCACKTVPITQQTISGRYDMIGKPEGLWYSGETLTLGNGTFRYSVLATLSDDPRIARYPVNGSYTLAGNSITLHHADVLSPQRTIIRMGDHFTLWTAKQQESFRDSRRVPEDVLIQVP